MRLLLSPLFGFETCLEFRGGWVTHLGFNANDRINGVFIQSTAGTFDGTVLGGVMVFDVRVVKSQLDELQSRRKGNQHSALDVS
jgi:hypothetical protein